MNLFFDTNVIVGYSLKIDPWNFYSKRVFNNDKPKYWSSTVKEESKKVLKNLLLEYAGFFYQIKDSISAEFISREEFFRIVAQIDIVNGKNVSLSQQNIAEMLWADGGWFKELNSFELFELLDDILEDMNETVFPNFEKCDNSLELYIRKKNYRSLYDDLHSLKEYCDGELNVVHKPDDEIVLDAHDLALSKMFDLYFITADKKLLRFANDILDLTKIKEMYFVEDAFYRI